MEKSAINNKDFEWALGLNRLCLDAIGLWPQEYDETDYVMDSKELRIPSALIIMLLGLILPQMYALSMVINELPLVVNNLAINFPASTATINIFILWLHRRELKSIIIMVINDWMRSKSSWELNIMLKQAGRARMFTIAGICMMIASIIGFCITPFTGLKIRIVNNITDPDQYRYLPMQTYYPFDTVRSPQFELTYIFQLFAVALCGMMFSLADNLFALLVFHVCGQCEILERKMSELVPDNFNEMVTLVKKDKQIFHQKVEELVKTHVYLLRFTASVEKSFNLLILVQVIFMSSTICCMGFAAIISDGENERPPIIQIVTLMGTAMNLLIHTFICCVACEILATHSLGFRSAIYNSNWYLLPAEYSKNLILIILRSKYPLKLTAGKFFYLSLNFFLRILKTSFAYFSLLYSCQ